ncbi:hypothetical protein CEV32_0155 [Brucella rhizosphaerae]|uniref:Antibiotic biosynthesis monooxygenase n=1 Tax=Brucella rhizosphaerae TaxID=571254 RepID=A0A256FH57_9HYPH|nr:hypothetical protein CEV32_0155 [Brucella rhizosphaerae]
MSPTERFAITPQAPYYMVSFSSQRFGGDDGYGEMADRMAELAARQPGYRGMQRVSASPTHSG